MQCGKDTIASTQGDWTTGTLLGNQLRTRTQTDGCRGPDGRTAHPMDQVTAPWSLTADGVWRGQGGDGSRSVPMARRPPAWQNGGRVDTRSLLRVRVLSQHPAPPTFRLFV